MTGLLVTAGRLVHGPASERVDDGAVLVEDGLIVAAGPREEVLRAPGAARAERRDHPDGTLLPGLVDAHVHLAFDGGDDPAGMLAGIGRAELADRMAERAGTLVRAGVTTARDLGDLGRATLDLRDAIRRDERTGPRLVLATTPLTSPGGHCWFLGGEVGTPAEAAALVADNARAGADLVKVMASGGAMTPGGPPMWQGQFSRDELAAIVRAATTASRPGCRRSSTARGARPSASPTTRTSPRGSRGPGSRSAGASPGTGGTSCPGSGRTPGR